MHLLPKHRCIINKFPILNYAPCFNRNSITEIIKKDGVFAKCSDYNLAA